MNLLMEAWRSMWEPRKLKGKRVRKIGGSFEHTGTVVAEFTTTAGNIRTVVEFDPPVSGMLHIYRPDQLEEIK